MSRDILSPFGCLFSGPLIEETPAGFNSGDIQSSMSHQLQTALCRSVGGDQRGFIPLDKLHSIISEDAVRRELSMSFIAASTRTRHEKAALICDKFRRVFAVLVQVGRVVSINLFIEEGVDDSTLPLVLVSGLVGGPKLRPKRKQQSSNRCFEGWPQPLIKVFEELQWMVLAPSFVVDTSTADSGLRLYSFDDRAILPWIEDDQTNMHSGGFGDVWRVKIHPEHHHFTDTLNSNLVYRNFHKVLMLQSRSITNHTESVTGSLFPPFLCHKETSLKR